MAAEARSLVINPKDNVEIRGDGHKYARRDIAEGEDIVKYGMPIGHATCAIAKNELSGAQGIAIFKDGVTL